MYTLKTDQPLTRRKSLHHIIDAEGGLVYSAGKLGPCIAWLHLREETEFMMVVGTEEYFPEFLVKLTPFPAGTSQLGNDDQPVRRAQKRL